jgi:hypothetical protein
MQTRKKPQVAPKTGRPEPQNNATETEIHRIGFRIFRPALPARVEMHAGRPARVFFHGLRGEVLIASGPWRASGDWWGQDAWQQDEWDLEIRFAASARGPATAGRPQRGVYCFSYDDIRKIWLVRGVFD